MEDSQIEMNPNRVVRYLGKSPEELTKSDLIKFVEDNNITGINFHHVAGDGRLKTLNFVITSKADLDRLLSSGERLDGSSLFSHIDATSSDLYIIPRYKTAFMNPFASMPTLDLLCSYYTKEGVPLPSSPTHIVRKSHEILKENTGLSLLAMGEVEYYIVADRHELYPTLAQRGYHESSPFTKHEDLRLEAMLAIAQAGGQIKYGHSEVGHILGEGMEMEQSEIEFLPVPLENAADQIVLARWILRQVAYKHGVTVSFAPKVLVGHSGNGLHIHTILTKNGRSVMTEGMELSDVARKVIAGYLVLASSLTAFGNTIPTSYLRLGTKQEAPTNVCWGARNRSASVRVPLGWMNTGNMVKVANPQESSEFLEPNDSQTVEFRCPDGSANVHLLLAGMAVAARHGVEREDALELADKLFVEADILSSEQKALQETLPELPASCWDSSECLLKDRLIYERDHVFSHLTIDALAKQLKSYNDQELAKQICMDEDETKKLLRRYLHCS